jgi:hypothetical protein
LPEEPPTAFLGDANAQRIRIGVGAGLNIYELHPEAVYPGSPQPVALDARIVHYRIVSGSSVVALAGDPDDPAVTEILGLAPGEATVEASLGSAVADLQIIVERQ